MKFSFLIHQTKGFSTLMVLGTIGVLLILVVWLTSTYIREMKLSRTSYDEVLAYANAEGMFEYAMLKVRNHREGFADSVSKDEADGNILTPTTERSMGMKSLYKIVANSDDETFLLETNNHLVIPLFFSTGTYISGHSKNPNIETWVQKVTGLQVWWLSLSSTNLSWTIVSMSGSESVWLTGSGDINALKKWIIRHKTSQCYDKDDGSLKSCDLFESWDEELQYFYDEEVSVYTFIQNNSDPYLMIFNDSSASQDIRISATTPFSLPMLSVRAEAKKNDSVQVFEFTEDKSRYYDVLKYWVYNDE